MCTSIRVLFHLHIFKASIFPWLHIPYFLRCANVGFIPYFCIVESCMCLGVYPFVFVPFLLFCTVLCLVSFTCIIVVFSLLFYLVRICLYVHGLSTVECCSFYLCVYLLWCVSLYFSWCVFCLCIFLLFVHSPFLLFYYLSTFYINRNLFLNLGLVAIRW